MINQKYTLKTQSQIKCFTISDEKLFRMSSCSHKLHNYDEQFTWKIFTCTYVLQKDILNVVNRVENLQETKRFLTIKLS